MTSLFTHLNDTELLELLSYDNTNTLTFEEFSKLKLKINSTTDSHGLESIDPDIYCVNTSIHNTYFTHSDLEDLLMHNTLPIILLLNIASIPI